MVSTREKIIDAAIDLFAEKGYNKASMRSLAEAVNIKPASIYNHFESKAEILELIITEYIDHSFSSIVSLDKLDELIGTEDAKTILNLMFYTFDSTNADRYMKMLKIIFHEQYREPLAMDFIKDYFFGAVFDYLKSVMDRLVQVGKIKPVDTRIYAKIMTSLNMASVTESLFYNLEEYQNMDRVTRGQALTFLIDQLVDE